MATNGEPTPGESGNAGKEGSQVTPQTPGVGQPVDALGHSAGINAAAFDKSKRPPVDALGHSAGINADAFFHEPKSEEEYAASRARNLEKFRKASSELPASKDDPISNIAIELNPDEVKIHQNVDPETLVRETHEEKPER